MVKKLKKDFEQLKEATDQIKKETPTGARLALLLIDNLLEIQMYRYTNFIDDDLYYRSTEEKDLKFNDQVDFIKNKGIINKNTSFIFKNVHELRNEAYHADILRENVLIPIAKLYHQEVCNLIPKLFEGNYYSGEVSEFLLEHGISGEMHISSEVLEEILTKYSGFSECKIDKFTESLCSDLISRIDETIQDMTFLANNMTMDKGNIDELLKWHQFWERDDLPEERSDGRVIIPLYNKFKPKIQCKTINKWKIRAKKLPKEKEYARALQIWGEIDSQLLPIQTTMRYAVYSLEQHIDDKIDAAKLE